MLVNAFRFHSIALAQIYSYFSYNLEGNKEKNQSAEYYTHGLSLIHILTLLLPKREPTLSAMLAAAVVAAPFSRSHSFDCFG